MVRRWDSITDEAVKAHRLRLFPKGTIVVPKSGASIRLEKRGMLLEDSHVVSHLAAVLARPDVVDNEFLFFKLASMRLADEKADGYPTLTISEIRDSSILLPPLAEQQSIAAILHTVQEARVTTETIIAAMRELKPSLLSYLLTYGPVPLHAAEDVELRDAAVGPMPRHWQELPLHAVATIERGKFTHRPRNDPVFYGGSVPFVQTGDITLAAARDGHLRAHSQTLNDHGLSVSRIFPKGTIAITIAANIGYAAILEFDSAFPDSIIAISPQGVVSGEYLNYYLSTQQTQMDRKAPRGTQKNINIQFLRPWVVKVPPAEEQSKIVRILGAVDRKLQAEERRRGLLDQVLSALLVDLFTGRRYMDGGQA